MSIMVDTTDICLCGIPELEQKQKQIFHNFNVFCDQMSQAIYDALRTLYEISMPSEIIDIMLNYSNQEQI